MAKYGIKHSSGTIIAISEFVNDTVPVGFTEITKAKYDDFTAKFNNNPFSTYDDVNNALIQDSSKLANFNTFYTKTELRETLMKLSNELDLQARMSEDTTATQAEFNTVKAQYDAL